MYEYQRENYLEGMELPVKIIGELGKVWAGLHNHEEIMVWWNCYCLEISNPNTTTGKNRARRLQENGWVCLGTFAAAKKTPTKREIRLVGKEVKWMVDQVHAAETLELG